ncbi:carbamoyl phosphate synthase small subunit [Salinithrix halophila]|uniref:Carbamoyl phosphate synthase small chain n=1 Tax=Salinithrix halophila TaxID=1485204 RepID=A0ABV8JES0_9BACL
MDAYLVFEDGETFSGQWIGSPKETLGEVVFTTGMTGYQEVMTDPSYAGQIVTFTYPLIGNYGTVMGESESDAPTCTGVVVSELFGGGENGLAVWLDRHGVPGLSGVDTRAVVRKIRSQGAMRGMFSSNPRPTVTGWPDPLSAEWVDSVSVRTPVFHPAKVSDASHIVLIDFGYKRSILQSLIEGGCQVTVVPWFWPPQKIESLDPDGLLFSNGPGDPKAMLPWVSGWVPLVQKIPTLGICLGHQILALAFGADTQRLPFGHRGSNHPVKELATEEVWMTSQNHGYAVCSDSLDLAVWELTHSHVNDGSVEGLAHRQYPIFTAQFHPEAHPGPEDAAGLFQRFIDRVNAAKEVKVYG